MTCNTTVSASRPAVISALLLPPKWWNNIVPPFAPVRLYVMAGFPPTFSCGHLEQLSTTLVPIHQVDVEIFHFDLWPLVILWLLRFNPLEPMNGWTQFNFNPSHSCWNISVWIKVVEWKSTVLLARLKTLYYKVWSAGISDRYCSVTISWDRSKRDLKTCCVSAVSDSIYNSWTHLLKLKTAGGEGWGVRAGWWGS